MDAPCIVIGTTLAATSKNLLTVKVEVDSPRTRLTRAGVQQREKTTLR